MSTNRPDRASSNGTPISSPGSEATVSIPLEPIMIVHEPFDRLRAVAVGALAAAVVFIGTVAFLTLLHVSMVSTNGEKTLKVLATNTTETHRIAEGLARGDRIVGAIFIESGRTVVQLESSQARIERQVSAICAALHVAGCGP